jgi:hypothetical protein
VDLEEALAKVAELSREELHMVAGASSSSRLVIRTRRCVPLLYRRWVPSVPSTMPMPTCATCELPPARTVTIAAR